MLDPALITHKPGQQSSTQVSDLPTQGNLNTIGQNELNAVSGSTDKTLTRPILPPSGPTVDYLPFVMLCRSLQVCSERSEGTRISTGLIFRTRPSSSERDWPSGKQSSNTSPVLGCTAYIHKHMHKMKMFQRPAGREHHKWGICQGYSLNVGPIVDNPGLPETKLRNLGFLQKA